MSINGKHFYRFTYLKSEEWKTARMVAMARAGAKCALCGKVDWHNDAHHRKYPEDIWNTSPHHLIVLCRACHEDVHAKFGKEASKRRWKSVKKAIETDRKIGYLKIHPEVPECVFCHTHDCLRKLIKLNFASLWVCPSCYTPFKQFRETGMSFWRSLDAVKEATAVSKCAVMLATRRIFRKLDKQRKKV